MSASIRTMAGDSSSDSEDAEELERLREASCGELTDVTSILHGCSGGKDHQSGKTGKCTTPVINKPSLRYSQNPPADDFNFNTDRHVTAEVKAFIAKKLSQSLDQSIEMLEDARQKGVSVEDPGGDHSSDDGPGFQMFSTKTQRQLDKKREARRLKAEQARLKRQQRESTSDSSDEDARLAEAAVSAEFVLQNSSMIPSSLAVETEKDQGNAGKSKMANSDMVHKNGVRDSDGKNDFCDTNEIRNVLKSKKKKRKHEKQKLIDLVEHDKEAVLDSAISNHVIKKKKKKCKHSHSISNT